MTEEEVKTELKDFNKVFSDFKDGTQELMESKIKNLVLHKKSNTLYIELVSKNHINISILPVFEKYINERFKIQYVNMKIRLEKTAENENPAVFIREEWNLIINRISSKHPMVKTILSGCNVSNQDGKLVIKLNGGGKDYLTTEKIDKSLSDLLNNFYDFKCNVEFKDGEIKHIEQKTITMPEAPISKPVEEKKIEVKSEKEQDIKPENQVLVGRTANLKSPLTKITDLREDTGMCTIQGKVILIQLDEKTPTINLEITTKDITSKKGNELTIITVPIYDGTATIMCKIFSAKDKSKDLINELKSADSLMIEGEVALDQYAREITMTATNVVKSKVESAKKKREDTCEEKRVELHLHTNMSLLDGISKFPDYLKRVQSWGWDAIAITDHDSVQAFPDAHHALDPQVVDGKFDLTNCFKVLYGVEANIVSDGMKSVFFSKNQPLDDTVYCVFDTETTGKSYRTDKLTEIGALKVKNGEIIDEFEMMINPEKEIPPEVVEVTHITNEMVKNCPTVDEVLPKFLEFIKDTVLVAHNADFDIGFMRYNAEQLGMEFDNTYLDTLRLARTVYPNFSKFKLGYLAEKLGIEVEVAHRALADVDTTVKVMNEMFKELKEKGVKNLDDIAVVYDGRANYKNIWPTHATVFATTQEGMKNLYKLISISHVEYFYKAPLMLKSIIEEHRDGIIIGSGCRKGELYEAILTGSKTDDELEEIADYYDFLEIQPPSNYHQLIDDQKVPDEEGLREIVRKIIEIGDKLGKPVVATGDVHFLDPEDELGRRLLKAGKRIQDEEYRNADHQAPLYLKTTDEMLEEFSFLGKDKAYEVVVTNSRKIADMCQKITPISPEKCPPHIDNCEVTIKEIAYSKAYELYGDPLPDIVKERMDKELDSIIKNGFSVMYMIAQKLVQKSNEDGFIVGSRGSVGSSFVAFLTGITEVNSLKAHYRCPKCKHSDFGDYGFLNGFDLPDKNCPECGTPYLKDGLDIPFETFLGFDGDKEPDIDLNFSGLYQAKAHRYTEVIFGKGTTFKAGTVSTVAGKTAYGYAVKYNEERGIPISRADLVREGNACKDIKNTTGQHPGGIIVVPKGREIYEFTPIQHPADDPKSDILTTHFDYHSIDQNLLKLDILGHDDPTMIRFLQDITGTDPTKVPLDDKETMSIFSSTKALGVEPSQINSEVGTFGVPEFGTKFVRGMLIDTKPTTFEELICISGLSHGTDVWLGNAQELIKSGTVTLNKAICTRDDIMLYLIKAGLDPKKSFKIMEAVRKGKVAKGKEANWPEYEQLMKDNNVPDWYIGSCKKIKYMFPKAHAAAYVTNAFRIAWYKVHNPAAYYAAYFTIRADKFDANIFCNGKEKVKNKMKEVELQGNTASATDKALYEVAELVNEMYERGIEFLPIDLYKSHPTDFKIEDGKIRPPLNSVAGLGTVAAIGIGEARKDGTFMSIEDLKLRSHIGDSVVKVLKEIGCIDGMQESNQMSLFG